MSKFQCGYCKKSFRKETTLAAHMCPAKRRALEENTVSSRMGLQLYNRFYELNTPAKKPKTFQDFIRSEYYTAFIKLARHLIDLKPIDQDRFIDFLFTSGIKERDWCKDSTYEKYVIDLLVKENPERALERSIMTMEEWAKNTGSLYHNFFKEVAPNLAVHLIQTGKISPWVLYLADSSDYLWDRINEEQGEFIAKVINPSVWRKKFESKLEHRQFVKSILDEANL